MFKDMNFSLIRGFKADTRRALYLLGFRVFRAFRDKTYGYQACPVSTAPKSKRNPRYHTKPH